jgi:heptosyltransferase-2
VGFLLHPIPPRRITIPTQEHVKKPHAKIEKLMVVLPSWVGDVVMATPALRALRRLYPDAKITYLLKSYVRPVVDASPWHDRLIVLRPKSKQKSEPKKNGRPSLQSRLKRKRFDAVVLLTNSFRSAFVSGLAGIPRRIGYDRDGRGLLLTDRLIPMKHDGKFTPFPMIDYYLGVARYLGAQSAPRKMQLFTRPEDDAVADEVLRRATGPRGHAPLILLNPGAANHGDAKLWPAERFAALADQLVEKHNAVVLVSGSPKDRPILQLVHRAARHPLVDLPRFFDKPKPDGLTLLKSIVKRCNLVVTNDTGARHVAVALGTPVVSLFGPTDPEWTRLDSPIETLIRHADGCAACAAGKTKGRHRCMTAITVAMVLEAAEQSLMAGVGRER